LVKEKLGPIKCGLEGSHNHLIHDLVRLDVRNQACEADYTSKTLYTLDGWLLWSSVIATL